jgi:6-phosphogluconolactonase
MLSFSALVAATVNAESLDVWVGTTTPRGGVSKGIYHATLDTDNGRLSAPRLVAEIREPGFLALHPSGDVLYATGTVRRDAVVVAYRIDRSGGESELTLLGSQPTGDGGAAHVATDRTGQVLFSAQYGGGSVAVYPLGDDGSIGPRSALVEHEGGSRAVSGRQDEPHPHWCGTSPDNRFVFVPDLGLDRVMVYELDGAGLVPHGFGEVPPGGGPRHMKFHPNGKFIYVLNELALSVTTFAYDANSGAMTPLETVSTLPDELAAKERFNSGSEIRVHPSGRFVYTATRGHDTITAFRVDDSTGRLTLIEREPIRGSWPRNFNVDPTGRWLLAAGRDSHTLAVFEIDGATGELAFTLHTVAVPTPICVVIGSPAG